MTRQQLLRRWESGLATNARHAEEDSRFHWVRRVYVRIYRFLISRYGGGQWRPDSAGNASEGEAELAARPMLFVDHTSEVTGLAPKSNEQIRGKLAAIREANGNRQSPGTATRPTVQQWVAVASTKNRKTAGGICRALRTHGFEVRKDRRTTDYCIEIRYGDFDEALSVLQRGEWRTAPKSKRFRLARTTSGPIQFVSLFGLAVIALACSLFAVVIISDALVHSPREAFLLLGILVACGLFMSSVRRAGR